MTQPRLLAALMVLGSVLTGPVALAAESGIDATAVKLGMVNAQSGQSAALGKGVRLGAEAVFKELNAHGGVNGRKIDLLVDDDGYEPDKTIDATLTMLEGGKIFSLFGYVGTPTGNAALPIVKEQNVPLVGIFSGAMSFRQPVVKQVFNVRASYEDEAEALVERFTSDSGSKRFAVFYQDDGFGQAVLSATEKALKKRGMSVVAKGTFERNTVAVQTGLASVMKGNPDTVIMVGPYTPVATFVKSARGAGLKAKLATVSFVGTDNLVKALAGTGDGVVISQVVPFPGDMSLPLTKECAEIVARHFPGEKLGFVNYEGCINAKVLALALANAGAAPTRASFLAALENLHDVDLGGLTINFGPGSHQASKKVFLTQIKAGQIQAITKID